MCDELSNYNELCFALDFSLSHSTLSISSGSSRGSLGSLCSLSASSRGSLNSLGSDLFTQSQYIPSDSSLQDLYRRVDKLLQGHTNTFSPIIEGEAMASTYTTRSIENITSMYATSHPYVNMQPSGSTLCSTMTSSAAQPQPQLQPQPEGPKLPSYQEHMQLWQKPAGNFGGQEPCAVPVQYCGVNTNQVQFDSSNSQDLSVAQLHLNLAAAPSGVPSMTLPMQASGNEMGTSDYSHHLCRRMLNSIDSSSNPPLSPISESSSGVCNNLSGGNTRSVSAAVSNESVTGDSGVFEVSAKRLETHCFN